MVELYYGAAAFPRCVYCEIVARKASSLLSRGVERSETPEEWIANKMFPQESSRSTIDDSLKGNINLSLSFWWYRFAQPPG